MSKHISQEAEAAADGLAPEAQFIVDHLASLKPVHESTAAEARFIRESKRNPLVLEERPLASIENIEIPTPTSPLSARCYIPQISHQGKLPGFLFFHGGGFVLGNLESHDTIVQNIAAESNCLAVSVAYRLAPETKFPGAVHDAFAAWDWFVQSADELGVDKNRIALGGDSAGGNLAAVTCLRNRDESGAQAAFQLLLYPVVDLVSVTKSKKKYASGFFLDQDSMRWFNRHYLATADQANNPYASPLLASSHSNLPPAHIITAGFDPLRDEGKAYADRLKEADVPVTHSCYTDMFHGFLNFGKALPQAQEAIQEIGRVLTAAFKS